MNRFPSREVRIGSVRTGGKSPVTVQSMVTSPTMDTEAVVREVQALADAGCQIVRVTAATVKEAENLKNIKNELLRRGCEIPLVADIHFLPQAALIAADYADKVRINPGNYIDWSAYRGILHTDLPDFTENSLYRNPADTEELDFIKEAVRPLAEKLKKLNKALRIGVNHGSLSERILNRFGNSPEGMVVSAVEFAEAFISLGFEDIVFSMKSSNPAVMVAAYRRLASVMLERNMNFPLHLGVTEAGDGATGRIRSSIGIGSLLLDGIGDTIRVSLTENSVEEIPAARALIESLIPDSFYSKTGETWKAYVPSLPVQSSPPPAVSGIIAGRGDIGEDLKEKLKKQGTDLILYRSFTDADLLYSDERISVLALQYGVDLELFSEELRKSEILCIIYKSCIPQNAKERRWYRDLVSSLLIKDADRTGALIVYFPHNTGCTVADSLDMVRLLKEAAQDTPLLLAASFKKHTLYALSALAGSLFLDKVISGVIADTDHDPAYRSETYSVKTPEDASALCSEILQAVRLRLTKADYISCPGCGRTHFQIMEVTRRIKEKTMHLAGVKIAVMGCIVNGPGEMADADFGYVGAGQGKITLYRGHTPVKRNIPEETAVEELLRLISESGINI